MSRLFIITQNLDRLIELLSVAAKQRVIFNFATVLILLDRQRLLALRDESAERELKHETDDILVVLGLVI